LVEKLPKRKKMNPQKSADINVLGLIFLIPIIITIIGMFYLPILLNSAVPGWGFIIGIVLDLVILLPFLMVLIFIELSVLVWD